MKAVFVLFDSLCRNALGCYGSPWVKTPNFDRFSRAAVKAIAAVRSIKEHFENRTVAGQQLAQLATEISDILGSSIVFMITIPR